MQKICKNIKKIYENDKKLIIVVSAMGNQTNLLLDAAENFSGKTPPEREISLLLSTGEIQSAALFSMALNRIGVPSVALTSRDIELRTFGGYQNATVYYLNKSKLNHYLNTKAVAVVCGFQGINEFDETTTLGRGGSDTTAVAIASAFSVSAEIYSDFDGVFAGDPRLAPYKKINVIDYDSMLNLANAGAKVLDARAVEIAKTHETVIVSKSSSDFDLSGTEISKISDDFVSIAKSETLNKITVVFSNQSKLKNLCENVLNSINMFKFYNLEISNNKIEVLVLHDDCDAIINQLSEKLGIIKKQD